MPMHELGALLSQRFTRRVTEVAGWEKSSASLAAAQR